MSTPVAEPWHDALRWLAQHTGYPRFRLPEKAETLVCVAALAAAEEKREEQRFALQRRDPAQTAALRTHGMRRAQVHYKCDNSAKV